MKAKADDFVDKSGDTIQNNEEAYYNESNEVNFKYDAAAGEKGVAGSLVREDVDSTNMDIQT